jgi:pilus assembly protein CpaB
MTFEFLPPVNTRLITQACLFLGVAGAVSVIGYGFYRTYVPPQAPTIQAAPVAAAPLEIVEVMTASRLIARGQVITQDDVSSTRVYGAAPTGAETSLQAVVGKVATADIPAHQLLLQSTVSSDPARAGLAALVPLGFRAISIQTNDEIAVGSFIRPGDRVDIELVLNESVVPRMPGEQQALHGNPSESRTLLQDIRVLTVGSTLGDPVFAEAAAPADENARAPEPIRTITVAMTPEQIAQFALARSFGTYYLALRNPQDPVVVRDNTAKLADIRGETPPPVTPPEPVEVEPRTIELVVGGRTQLIYPQTFAVPR